MADYRASEDDGVVRTSDGVFIARAVNSPDWQAFLNWQAAGGVLDPVVTTPPVYQWYIDIGPFFDRFGSAKMAVLTSTDTTVAAIVEDVKIRKWIDLQKPAVAQGINALISLGVSGVTAALRDSILTTPVLPEEQSAVVKMYFTR